MIGSPTELAVAGDDRGTRVHLARFLAQPAGVDLERRAGLDERREDRLVELGRLREVGGRHMWDQVALDEVDVAERVEQLGPHRP